MNDTDMLPGSYPHRIYMVGLKHHIVEIRGGVTDAGRRQTLKIELLSQWMLEAEFRNFLGGTTFVIWTPGKGTIDT